MAMGVLQGARDKGKAAVRGGRLEWPRRGRDFKLAHTSSASMHPGLEECGEGCTLCRLETTCRDKSGRVPYWLRCFACSIHSFIPFSAPLPPLLLPACPCLP